jgi:hypothetical protein
MALAESQGKTMEQAAEAVTGGQEPCEADGAKNGEAPEKAPAPNTAGAPALPHHRRSKRSLPRVASFSPSSWSSSLIINPALFACSASSGRNSETCSNGGASSHGIVGQRFHRPAQVLLSSLDITDQFLSRFADRIP